MRLTREQIERIYFASQDDSADEFYVEEDESGRLRFGIVTMVEKRTPIRLTHAEQAKKKERA